jgi:tRNA threonylcarbamoyladenosine biosynthesis protein TsaB
MIINIETTATHCSVALAQHGTMIGRIADTTPLTHAEQITTFIHHLLQENNLAPAQLTAIAISEGPGSYTGLRIGAAAAKGLCFALDIPLIAVSTLESMTEALLQTPEYAHQLPPHAHLVPMIDARRMEVYTATYDVHINNITTCKSIVLDENYLNDDKINPQTVFFGSGASKLNKINNSARFLVIETDFVDAQYLCRLSYKKYQQNDFENLAYYQPFYLKEAHITKPK